MISKWLLGDQEKAHRNGTIWNTIASAEYSFQSAILLLVVTRIGGLTEAGIFTITYTIAQMMATIGSYDMRDYQSSDIKRFYRFPVYWTSRMVTILIMLIVCIGYAVISKYTGQKLLLITSFSLYRAVDNIEDVLQGEMQRSFRLDVAARIMTVRIFLATLAFVVGYAATRSLLLSAGVLTLTALLVEIVLSALVVNAFGEIRLKWETKGVGKLLFTCFPLCAGGFLYNYLATASKYAIDRNMQEESQTIFGILFMPNFVINMLSMFAYKPMIAGMGQMWSDSDKGRKRFFSVVIKLSTVIIGITGIVAVGGYTIGLDLLGFIYGVSLDEYRSLLAVLLLFGGVAAMDSFFVLILTIMRRQKLVIVAYAIAASLNLVLADRLVEKYRLWGAGLLYGITMGLVMIILLVFILMSVKKYAEHILG